MSYHQNVKKFEKINQKMSGGKDKEKRSDLDKDKAKNKKVASKAKFTDGLKAGSRARAEAE